MPSRNLAALAAALLVAVPIAGCGDDKSNRDAAYTAPETTSSDEARADAAQTKSDVRNAQSRLEVCFVDNQDYSQCKGPDVTNGKVQVTEASASTYTLEGRSKSGGVFRVEKSASGASKRTCSGPGCEGGSW